MLNAQKRRCRGLWESTTDQPEDLGRTPFGGEAHPTQSLEECLLRQSPEAAEAAVNPGPSSFVSLTFGDSDARPAVPEVPAATETAFSIPLTLGMSTVSLGARVQKGASVAWPMLSALLLSAGDVLEALFGQLVRSHTFQNGTIKHPNV